MSTIPPLSTEQARRFVETALGGLVPSNVMAAEKPLVDAEQRLREITLVKLVMDDFREAETALAERHKRWALNTEYFADNQLAAWNPKLRTLMPTQQGMGAGPVAGDQQHGVTINIFKPAINAIVARFLATRPQIIIKPGSTQEEVVEACRAAQRIVAEYEWERQGMEEVLAESVPNLVLHGTTIWKIGWNRKGGNYLGKLPVPLIDKNGEPVQKMVFDPLLMQMTPATDPSGKPIWETKRNPTSGEEILEDAWEGCIETFVVLAKDFIVDPMATKFSRAKRCTHRYEMSHAAIFDKWGKDIDAITASQNETNNFAARRGQLPKPKARSVVYETWFAPGTYKFGPSPTDNRYYPKGYVIIATETTLLQEGENPYDHGEFPFVFIPCLRVPGEAYGGTVADSLRGLQNQFNKCATSITDTNSMMASPQWLLPNGCKMPEQDRINRPGIHRRYESGLNGEKPEIVPGVGVAPSVWRYFDSLRSLFQEVSGVREGGLAGGAPGSIESGKALNALIERDVSKLAGIGLELGRGIKRWAWLTTKLIQQYWDERKSVSVVGHHQLAEVISFGGVDVHDSFDISVTPESTMPQTQAIKQAKADALLDRGLIQPYDYLRRIGEDTAEEFTREALEVSNARMENAFVRRNGIIPIMQTPIQMEVEDHLIHMEEHKRELLNPSLRKDQAKWEALYEHYKAHEELANQAMEAALQQQAAAAQAMAPPQANSAPGGPQGKPAFKPGEPTPPPPPGGLSAAMNEAN